MYIYIYIYITPAYDYNIFLIKILFWRLGAFWLATGLDIGLGLASWPCQKNAIAYCDRWSQRSDLGRLHAQPLPNTIWIKKISD